MGMLFTAGLFFIGIHICISSTPLRGWLIQRIGARPYQGVFSLLSLAGIIWLIWSYMMAERFELGQPHVALTFLAVMAAMAGLWLAILGFASVTSIIPFAEIARGRNQLVSSEIGWWRPLLALLAAGLLIYFHGSLFGAAIL